MRSHSIPILLLLLAISGGAISVASDRSVEAYSVLEIPTLVGARTPRLHAGSDGLTLSWLRGDEVQAQLEYSQLGNHGWGPVNVVAQGDGWLANPYDYAQVIPLSNQVYLAVWLELTSFRDYSYRFNTRVSADAGKSWTDSRWPEQLKDYGQHGFAAAALSGDVIQFFWISSYQNNGQLYKADIGLNGQWSSPEVIDERVCNCCHLALSESFLLSYRNRSETEIRDIALIRDAREGTAGKIIHADNWEISGCPVNAPAIDENGQWAALAWFSRGRGDAESGNRLAIGRLANSTRWQTKNLGLNTLGQVDIAWLDRELLALSSVSTSQGVTYIDLQVFKTIDGMPELQKQLAIPVDSIIGAPSIAHFRGHLYLGYYSPTQAASRLLKIDLTGF